MRVRRGIPVIDMDDERDYATFFEAVTGNAPYPYQVRLGEAPWPEVLDVPTGLGKTAAVVVAWLYKRLTGDPATGRRLVYCLPMRTLVEQTRDVAQALCSAAAPHYEARALDVPAVSVMLGGHVDEEWEAHPERPAILVGTQDMLLSRALARGYAMSRYKWPIHFGLMHNDCLWVFDETQLMGVAVETSAQLEALRARLGVLGPAHSVWMSATLGRGQLATVDHPEPDGGFARVTLTGADHDASRVRERTTAKKTLMRGDARLEKKKEDSYIAEVAALAEQAHRERGGLTLVVVNRVQRAQAIHRALGKLDASPRALVHSRFRPLDRRRHEDVLKGDGDRVVVATQAVEAGVDVSARTLITELAPWPSMVQRFGRCNRYGEQEDARVVWLDVDDDADLARPYDGTDLSEARGLLGGLAECGPVTLATVGYRPPRVVRPVLRRRDLLDLFDTSPDLLGNDIDVSRFVRDGDDTDVLVYFRVFDGDPDEGMTAPGRDELVRVSIGAARTFLDRLTKKRRSLGDGVADRERKRWLRVWRWDPLAKSPWTRATTVHPGQVLMLHGAAGGYAAELGWTGELLPKEPVEPVAAPEAATLESMDLDPSTGIGRWVTLATHLSDVATEARGLTETLEVPAALAGAVTTAALWHDAGKAHEQFQRRIMEPVRDDPEHAPPGDGPWAKSGHRRRPPKGVRPYFRHELASALAFLRVAPDEHEQRDLVAYLIAAHHGKVRLSIRSVPGEERPPEPDRLFARGVWHGDALPEVDLGDGTPIGPVELDLTPMLLGEGSWLERTLALRDDPELGPFRLAFLEALVRVADWRASEKEEQHDA